MSRTRLLLPATVALTIGCGTELPSSQPGTSMDTSSSVVDLNQTTPHHVDATAWKFLLDSANGPGPGDCASTTLANTLDVIRDRFADVRQIREFRPSGPRGVTLNAGPATRVGDAVPPADGTSSFVTAKMDEHSFGVTFFRGERCRGDQCLDREFWYFETGANCQPRWVGHHHAVDQIGGLHGTCVDVEGKALWGFPAVLSPRSRCDADWSAQNISGTRKALSLDPGGTCGSKDGAFVPVEITIRQGTDLSKGEISVNGTGIPFFEGRYFSGTVERQGLTADIDEPLANACGASRQFKIRIDLEEPSINGLPGGFGFIDISDTVTRSCPNGPSGCRASLHFIRSE